MENDRNSTSKMVKLATATEQLELMTNGQDRKQNQVEEMTSTTTLNDQRDEVGPESAALSSTGVPDQWPRPRSRRPRRSARGSKRVSRAGSSSTLRSMLFRFVWSSSRAFNFVLITLTAFLMISFKMPAAVVNCDDEAQLNNLYSDFEHQKHKSEFYDLIQNQRDGQDGNGLESDQLNNQQQGQSMVSTSSNTNEIGPGAPMYTQFDDQQQDTRNPAANSNQQANDQHTNNEPSEPDQLDTAQTNSQSNSISATATQSGNQKTSEGGSGGTVTEGGGKAQTGLSSGSASSSSVASLSEHLSAVNKLIQQAGQLGLSAAQQNVALSEAIINSLSGNAANRRPNVQISSASTSSLPINAAATAAPPNRPTSNLVGQSIDGNINYDPNSNTINGFIDFPNFPNLGNLGNLTGSLPSLGGAVKPLLLAAIKTAPIKIGSIGWKLLKVLAWKKIYKAHHPKSGEIIIEQEMKNSGGPIISGDDKTSKIKDKINDHFESKFKGTRMNQGAFMSDDWMRSTGGSFHNPGDMFSGGSGGGWPHGDSQASASMIYQRHMLPLGSPSVTNPTVNGAGNQQAAAVAAAAAATAAVIQSHWHQQQQMVSEESGDNQLGKTNQTSSAASALRRKKASFGGGNWFAANPAHAYAAAAAAANAAAAVASQQQQQQRLLHLMRGYDPHGHHPSAEMMHGGDGVGGGGNGLHHALATGMMYQSLFDNAASVAVQNAVKLPPTHHHHHHGNHLEDYMDQSDSLSGTPFGSLTHTSVGPGDNLPMSLLQRHDIGQHNMEASNPIQMMIERPPPSSAMDNFQAPSNYLPRESPAQSSLHRSNSLTDSMTDFDDTPAGKILGDQMNYSSY